MPHTLGQKKIVLQTLPVEIHELYVRLSNDSLDTVCELRTNDSDPDLCCLLSMLPEGHVVWLVWDLIHIFGGQRHKISSATGKKTPSVAEAAATVVLGKFWTGRSLL